ncbi:Trans-2-enoyl-CoA reductase, mitochondrial [Smittium culicis]|uniref:enoyl-[acyl-carrier-protein] reductase n=1 Tax=Smittium culicis TaxID=133412 RepID=A0A1R1XYV8_9FUNG|nr:Trans-2-enoyl-CoA reductase, mitochondrial [Smittium culicis]
MPINKENDVATAVFTSELGLPSKVVSVHEIELGPLAEDQVAIDMLVSSINPVDKLTIEGGSPVPLNNISFKLSEKNNVPEIESIVSTMLGLEGVGRVVKIGSNAKKAINGDLQVGDYVIPFSFGKLGSWATRIHLSPSDLVVFKQDGRISARDLSSVNINISTAYRMLLDIENLKAGDYVIQNGANSSVGKYVIQLANIWGFKTINIIRDRPDFDKVADNMKKLGADIVIKDIDLDSSNTRDLLGSLSSPIRLGLNFVNGPNAAKMANFLSHGATFATYGTIVNEPIPIYPNLFLLQRLKFVGFSLFEFYFGNPKEEWVKTWENIIDLLKSKKLKPQDSQLAVLYDETNNNKHFDTVKFRDIVLNAINSNTKTSLVLNKD